MKIALASNTIDIHCMIERQNRGSLPVREFSLGLAKAAIIGDATNRLRQNDAFTYLITGFPVRIDHNLTIETRDDFLRCFRNAEGAFAAIFYDAVANEILIVTDFLGAQPIYLMKGCDGFALATETQAFDALPCLAGWGAFISFGHVIGDRSLANGVERLPRGSMVTIDLQSLAVTRETYWSIPSRGAETRLDDLRDEWEASVEDYLAMAGVGTLLLSGGFDSRLVAHSLVARGLRPQATIVAHADAQLDTDRKLALQVAQQLELDTNICAPDPNFFSQRGFLDYLADTDAATPSLYLFIAQVHQFINGPACWEGLVPGFVFKSGSLPGGGFDAYLKIAMSSLDNSTWRAAKLLFRSPIWQDMWESFQADLTDERAQISQDDYGVYWFYCRNRSRNRTGANSFHAFAEKSTPCQPGLSRNFAVMGANIDQSRKIGQSVYFDFLQRYYPRALEIPFLTGSSIMAANQARHIKRYINLQVNLADMAARYPRWSRPFQWILPQNIPMQASCWGNLDFLWDETDLYLNPDARKIIHLSHPDYLTTIKLLLHWRMWQWLHKGELFTRTADTMQHQ